MAVAIHVVHARGCGPELAQLAHPGRREGCRLTRIGAGPLVGQHNRRGVRRMLRERRERKRARIALRYMQRRTFNTLLSRLVTPFSIWRTSSRMATMASQKRSSSALVSLSVGSIMSVPDTGQDMVGAWKP